MLEWARRFITDCPLIIDLCPSNFFPTSSPPSLCVVVEQCSKARRGERHTHRKRERESQRMKERDREGVNERESVCVSKRKRERDYREVGCSNKHTE